jgi:hypothetical protein
MKIKPNATKSSPRGSRLTKAINERAQRIYRTRGRIARENFLRKNGIVPKQ